MSRHEIIAGQRRHLHGWKADRPDHRDEFSPMFADLLAKTPPLVDLPGCPRVEDQGELGACTGHGSTSVMEMVGRKIGLAEPEMSRLFPYWTTRVLVEHGQASEDSGCQIRDVLRALAKYGTCPEALYPYDTTKFADTPPQAVFDAAKQYVITSYFRLPGLSYIKACLAQGYPAVGGFSVPASMMDDAVAKTGIVPYPGRREQLAGGHCVMFMGYDDATHLLKFQNSWGTGWGAHGYGFLPYAYVDNLLATDFWTIRRELAPALPPIAKPAAP